ncbi:MAG: hypothetical protein IE886_02210 [Campylobacterales bacterium]|nr:hypothetical protein [Campylobacterales bacterium]
MRLQNLLSLTGAEMMSDPAVTLVDAIVLDVQKVRRGDLFIAFDAADIPKAVANGAYAVLYEEACTVTDPEIAWLKVESVEYTLLRLLRFRMLEKSLHVYSCDDVTLAVAAQMLKDPRCYVWQGTLRTHFYDLWELHEGSWVFVPERKRCEDLFVQVLPLPKTGNIPVDIAEQTLFETSFVLDDVYYERMQLSPFFLPYLGHLYQFAKSHGLTFIVGGMQGSTHFVPVFVGDDLRVKTFGQGGRVLIFEPDLSLLLREVDFIRSEAKWAKIIYLMPKGSTVAPDDHDTFLLYETQEDIIQLLKTVPFHFALIGGQDRRLLETMHIKTETPTLF